MGWILLLEGGTSSVLLWDPPSTLAVKKRSRLMIYMFPIVEEHTVGLLRGLCLKNRDFSEKGKQRFLRWGINIIREDCSVCKISNEGGHYAEEKKNGQGVAISRLRISC